MKKYKFFYHYNKPLSKQRGMIMWSVHFRNKCHFAHGLMCMPPAMARAKKTQPYAVMEGLSEGLIIDGENSIIIK